MRRLVVSILFAAALPFCVLAPPGTAAEMPFVRGETTAQFLERLRSQAVTGDLRDVIAELVDYVQRHPDEIEPARLLGDFYYRKPDMVAAERVYKSIVFKYPTDRETWNRLGGIYSAEDRVDEAIAAFDKSIPEPSSYPNLVELHRRRGDLASFERETADAAAKHPDARSLLIYGNVLRALHKYDIAVGVLQRALAEAPDAPPALNDLANVYLDTGKVTDAVPLLEKCLRIDPSAYFALVNLGEARIELGQFDLARTFLQRAVQVRADRPEAYVDLGYLEDTAHHWKPAVQYYQQAIAVDPLSRDAYIDLGYDYNDAKLYALAEAAFLKGLSVAPRDGRLTYMLAVTYVEQGKFELARQQYQHAISFSDEEIVIRAARRDLALLNSSPSPSPVVR